MPHISLQENTPSKRFLADLKEQLYQHDRYEKPY